MAEKVAVELLWAASRILSKSEKNVNLGQLIILNEGNITYHEVEMTAYKEKAIGDLIQYLADMLEE